MWCITFILQYKKPTKTNSAKFTPVDESIDFTLIETLEKSTTTKSRRKYPRGALSKEIKTFR